MRFEFDYFFSPPPLSAGWVAPPPPPPPAAVALVGVELPPQPENRATLKAKTSRDRTRFIKLSFHSVKGTGYKH